MNSKELHKEVLKITYENCKVKPWERFMYLFDLCSLVLLKGDFLRLNSRKYLSLEFEYTMTTYLEFSILSYY